MRRMRYVTAVLVTGGVLATASAAAAAKSPEKTSSTTVLQFKASKYGMLLEDKAGRTLYGLTADKPNKSTCKGSCTTYWPPLIAKGKLVAGKGVHKAWLKDFSRSKSTHQVEYHGIPLYSYVGDTGHGQVNGFGVKEYGGTWYPVSTAGKLTKKKIGGTSGGGGW